jgi:hypothetical protein
MSTPPSAIASIGGREGTYRFDYVFYDSMKAETLRRKRRLDISHTMCGCSLLELCSPGSSFSDHVEIKVVRFVLISQSLYTHHQPSGDRVVV